MTTNETKKPAVIFTIQNPAPAEYYCKWCGYRGGNHNRAAGTQLIGTRCRECYRVATE